MKCANCGIPEDQAEDFIDTENGTICGDCFDNGCFPSRADQMVYKRTGYVVERS